jgi:hypothetical protein
MVARRGGSSGGAGAHRLRCWGTAAVLATACAGERAGTDADDRGGTANAADDGPNTGGADGAMGSSSAPLGSGDDDEGPDASESGGGGGPVWSTSLEVGERVGALWSVWGSAPNDVWAVGGQTYEDGLTGAAIFHHDGSTWTADVLPEGTQGLNWIFGVGDRLIAVGEFGTIRHRVADGEWATGSCATALPLWGVWGATADDLWIVGGDGFLRDPVLCHFDGEAFAAWDLPPIDFETFALYKVWGTAADDVWAVGDNGLLMHFDGVQWALVDSGTEVDLISLWGRGPDDIVAVGGRSDGVVLRWDGSAWTSASSGTPGLNGVFMRDDGDAIVVGMMGTALRVPAGTLVLEPEQSMTILSLHAVFGTSDGVMHAVGGNLDTGPPFVGTIQRRQP